MRISFKNAILLLLTTGVTLGACTQSSQQADNADQLQNNTTAVRQLEELMPKKQEKTIENFAKITASEVLLETSKGSVVIELYSDKAPLTVANFLDLIESKFYDGIIFHRVIPGFMAQVGDPLTKEADMEGYWGTGGPGYVIADEFHPELKHDQAGILSMANAGPNSGGSQIFITYGPQPHLDGKHAVFGKVVSGMSVLESIEKGDKIITATYK